MTENKGRVAVIIPAYEPDERMLELLRELRPAWDGEIVVVDDGGGSAYAHLFEAAEREFGCRVLRHHVNLGKGRALKTAFNDCLNRMPDLAGVITADSDGQHVTKDILRMRDALLANPGALVMGCRDFDAAGIPWKSTFGNKLTRSLCALLTGVKVSDTQTGLRGIPAAFMARLMNTPGERFEFEMRMLMDARDAFPTVEVPIETIYDSAEHHQTHFRPVADSLKIMRVFGANFVRFLISSLSSFVVDILLFEMFARMLDGSGLVWAPALAVIMARVLSALYNYTVNDLLVFRTGEKRSRSLPKYVALAAAQMLLSAGLTQLGVTLLGSGARVIVKAVVDAVLFVISYTVQREFVFRRR